MHQPSPPKVLIIAGTDPLSGAGVIADAMTARALATFPLVVPTALVDQDSHGVHSFQSVDLDHMERTLKRTLQDGRPDAIKVGMLGDPHMASLVFRQIQCHAATVPVVIDPILAGGGPNGGALTRPAATNTARHRRSNSLVDVLSAVLRPTMMVTPNALELAAMLGSAPARTTEELEAQARELADDTDVMVLAKGGHTASPGVDVFVCDAEVIRMESDRTWDADLHGTGCALSTAIAAFLARGAAPREAVTLAKRYLEARVAAGVIQVGQGRAQILAGPV